MTSDDISKVQIIATTKDGQHFVALSDNKVLIRCITAIVKFMRLKDDLFIQCSLKELMEE